MFPMPGIVIRQNRHTDRLFLYSGEEQAYVIPLRNYTVGLGEDEKGKYVSYYDVWDVKSNAVNKYFDRLPEVYDRIYYEETNDGVKHIPIKEESQAFYPYL